MRKITRVLMLVMAIVCCSFSANAIGEITFTTSRGVGETVQLNLKADGEISAEGFEQPLKTGYGIYKLTSSEVTLKGDITFFACSENDLTMLDLSKCETLADLQAVRNPGLTSIDLSKNKNLTKAYLYEGGLEEIILGDLPLLSDLRVYANCLSSIDLSGLTGLQKIWIYSNNLEGLNVSANVNLEELLCDSNPMTELDLSKNTALVRLNVNGVKLGKLDLSNNTNLVQLACGGCNLKELDLKNNTKLESITAYSNDFTALDLSGFPNLKTLAVFLNQIKVDDMHKIVESLPERPEKSKGLFVVVDATNPAEKNVCSKQSVALAAAKNWDVKDFAGGYYKPYEGSDDAPEEPTVLKLYVGGVQVDSNNASDILGDGSAVYDFATKTLTLKNADFTSPEGSGGIANSCIENLVINLVGNNKVASQGSYTGLGLSYPTTITGSGTLHIASEQGAVYINKSQLTIKDCDVKVSGKVGIVGYDGRSNEKLIVDNSTLTVLGEQGATFFLVGMELVNCNFVSPEGVHFDEAEHAVVDKNSDLFMGEYAVAPNNVGNKITFATSRGVGETVQLNLKADGEISAEGFEQPLKTGYGIYTLTSSEVTLKGDITFFACSENDLTMLDLSKCETLADFQAVRNPELTFIDLSKNKNLTKAYLFENGLSNIMLGDLPLLSDLRVYANSLSSIDLSGLTGLKKIWIYNNSLESLNVSANVNLEELLCDSNPITELDFSKNTALVRINVNGLNLGKLDLSNNINLVQLACGGCNLKELDLKNNTKLESITAYGNEFTTLDLSGFPNLKTLAVFSNQIKVNDMHKIAKDLPVRSEKDKGMFIVVDATNPAEKNVCSKQSVALAIEKNWNVKDFAGGRYLSYEGTDDVPEEPTVLKLYVGGVQVDSNNASDILGDGSAVYDFDTKTLTLTNADFTSPEGSGGIANSCIENLVINLVGDNKVASQGSYTGLGLSYPTTITGSGTLHIASEQGAVYINKSQLTIKDCDVKVSGKVGIVGYDGRSNEKLIVDNSTLTVSGEQGATFFLAGMELVNCNFVSPEGVHFDEAEHAVVNKNSDLFMGEYAIAPNGTSIGLATEMEDEIVAIYNLQGQLVKEAPAKGFYIVKTKRGNAKKVFFPQPF